MLICSASARVMSSLAAEMIGLTAYGVMFSETIWRLARISNRTESGIFARVEAVRLPTSMDKSSAVLHFRIFILRLLEDEITPARTGSESLLWVVAELLLSYIKVIYD